MKNLYVGNLPHSTTEPQLRTLFEVHGKVERVNIITDKETGRSKGFAFVEMTESRDADKACLALTGRELEGRALQSTKPRPNRPRIERLFSAVEMRMECSQLL